VYINYKQLRNNINTHYALELTFYVVYGKIVDLGSELNFNIGM